LDETQEQITARIVAQAATATASAVSEAASAAALVLAKENATVLTTIAVLGTEVNMIKNQQSSFESEVNRRMDNLDPKFEKIFNKLDNVALGRPTWATSLTMGGLFSLCVGLIVFVMSHHG
jgi:phage-related protein